MNRYKMVALDVDGTLINDDHEITPDTMRSVRRLAEQGTEIVLCTGRSPSSTLPLLELIGIDGTIITHNGAATVESRTRRVLHQFSFALDRIAPYIEYCRRHHIHFDVNTAFDLYVEDASVLTEEALEMYGRFYIEPQTLPSAEQLGETIVKFTAFAEKDELDRVEKEWAQWDSGLHMIRSGDFFIDVMHGEASKGNSLREWARIRGIERSEVLAIGNYYNDITMLQFAGVGIAMDNSPLEVKEAADDVTATNNEDGVHAALLKYCL